MRRSFRQLALLLIVSSLFVAAPVFATCQRCETYTSGNVVATYCRDLGYDEMGNLRCRVECYSDEDFSICDCYKEGDWCMSIVVGG